MHNQTFGRNNNSQKRNWAMDESQNVDFSDDRGGWAFNKNRTRAARCRDLGSFDQYGLKQEQLIEVWHVSARLRIAEYRHDYFEDFERNIVSAYVSDYWFSEDGRELIIKNSGGGERRETFPYVRDYLPEINSYVDALRDALSEEQVARVEALDGKGDLPGDTEGGAADSNDLIYLLADAACRRFAPPAFDAAGLPDVAQRLRALSPINSEEAAGQALVVCKTLGEGCGQEPLKDVLSAAASAVEAATGFSSSAGGHAAEVAKCAQKAVGEGREITDAATELIRELTALSRQIPLPRYVKSFIEQTCDVSELEMLRKFYRSEITLVLIDIRIGNLSVPSYQAGAENAKYRRLSYEEGARQAEARLRELNDPRNPKPLAQPGAENRERIEARNPKAPAPPGAEHRESDDPWILKALARLMPFKKVQRPPESEPPGIYQQSWMERESSTRQERKSKFAIFEERVRKAQSGRDVVGVDEAYERGSRTRRIGMAEKSKRIYEQKAGDAENERRNYKRLAAELEENKRICGQYRCQAGRGTPKGPE